MNERVAQRVFGRILIDAETGCWEWVGSLNDDGYAQFALSHTFTKRVARFLYEEEYGPLDPSIHLDHLCRNRPCVNPAHLDPVTPRVNILRGVGPTAINARREYCTNGHDLSDPDVLYVRPNGWRQCRVCQSANARRYVEKQCQTLSR